MHDKILSPVAPIDEAELRRLEAEYCSYGDTVHYMEEPKFFDGCEGSYMYDAEGRQFLDLQMWYSAVNFGYRNPRLNAVAHRQLDTLPQVASQYLHREKVELAAMIAQDMEAKFGRKGRVHFNVGGAQAVEDSLKLVRNASNGKQLMFAFEGGYHGRTLGASAITSSYRYRRRFGHFSDRAQFIEFPYHFRGPKGMTKEEYGHYCVQKFARLFETEYNGVLDTKTGEAEYAAFYIEPIQGTGGYVIPPPNFFIELKKVLDQHGIKLVVDEIQMGMYRTGKLWSIEHFGVQPDVLVFGKALTNGLNPLKGAYFLKGLQELQKRWPQIGDVDGLGLALRCEICQEDGFTPNKKLLDLMADEGMKGDLVAKSGTYGLILDVGGYYKNVITLAPSLEITHEEIDLAIELLDILLRRCTAA